MDNNLILFISIAFCFVLCIVYLILFPVNCNRHKLIESILDAQMNLHKSRDLYRHIVDSLDFAVCLLDNTHKIRFANLKFQQLVTLPYTEILNNDVDLFLSLDAAGQLIFPKSDGEVLFFDTISIVNISDNQDYIILKQRSGACGKIEE